MYYKFCHILTVLLHANNIEKSSEPSDVIWLPHTYGVNVNSGVLWFCKQEASTSGHSSDIFIKCPMRVCFLDGSLFSAVFQKPLSFFVKYWRNPCTGLNKIINKALRKFSISWFSFTFLMLLAPINFLPFYSNSNSPLLLPLCKLYCSIYSVCVLFWFYLNPFCASIFHIVLSAFGKVFVLLYLVFILQS